MPDKKPREIVGKAIVGKAKNPSLSVFPVDILLEIFKHLSGHDLAVVGMCSHRFYNVRYAVVDVVCCSSGPAFLVV